MSMGKKVVIFGFGPMAHAYLDVLQSLDIKIIVAFRSIESKNIFLGSRFAQFEGIEAKLYAELEPGEIGFALVAVAVEALTEVSEFAIKLGIKRILVEKPGFLKIEDGLRLKTLTEDNSVDFCIAFNRRFYGSVIQAERLIEADGGLQSIFFDFTEWSNEIAILPKSRDALANWVVSNSLHVIDLAFFFSGPPEEIYSLTKGSLNWHPAASTFVGCGRTSKQVLFNYMANWDSAGRWRIELHTSQRKILLSPMEQCKYSLRDTLNFETLEMDRLDQLYKPGLYRQICAFLAGEFCRFSTLSEYIEMRRITERIAGY